MKALTQEIKQALDFSITGETVLLTGEKDSGKATAVEALAKSPDVQKLLQLSMHFNFEYGYYLYNFCTLLDAEAYIELFPSLKINIINQKNIALGERALSKINLCDYIPTRMIYSNVAFIYFVDDFTSLYDNHLYFELRDVSKDIVIDRQCNIVFASEIKKKVI